MRNIKDNLVNLNDYLGNKEIAYTYDSNLNILGILIAINDDDNDFGLKEGGDEGDEEEEDEEDEEDYIFSNSRRVANRRNKKKKKKKITVVTKPNVFVQLYDNFNGSFLKKFSFYSNRNNSVRISYQLFIDDDKLIVIEKSFQNKIFLFSLNFDRD
jgi:isocitrate/isopropylmalate dehydrogenase